MSDFQGLPKTTNLNLNKPGYDNVADIMALNENADIIDAAIKTNIDDIANIKKGYVKTVNGVGVDSKGNVNVKEYTHPASGVTAGSYRKVTVDTLGHVTAGENPILAIAEGGTGATTVAAARNALGLGNTTGALPVANGGTGVTSIANIITALFGTSALGSSTKPIYYTGSAFAACAASVGAANNGGIIAASLKTNGYVKFANGLILQWGIISSASKDTTTSLTFPIAFGTAYAAVFGSNSHGSSFDYCFEWASNISTTGISYRSGGANRTNIYWVAVGKA